MGGLLRLLRRHRRVIAFVLAFLGVLFGLAALREQPAGWQGLVASHDLPAGHVITAGDLATVTLSAAAQPANAVVDVDAAVGRVLAGAMVSGETLLHSRLVGPGLLAGSPAGLVAMPIRLDDSTEASFLRPGDRVDVLAARRTAAMTATGPDDAATEPATAEVIARDVQVLAIPGDTSNSTGALLGGSGVGAGGSVLVVAVAQTQATQIAGAAANARLSVVLRPGG